MRFLDSGRLRYHYPMQMGDRYRWAAKGLEACEVEIASPPIPSPEGNRIMVRILTGPHRRTFALVNTDDLSDVND